MPPRHHARAPDAQAPTSSLPRCRHRRQVATRKLRTSDVVLRQAEKNPKSQQDVRDADSGQILCRVAPLRAFVCRGLGLHGQTSPLTIFR